MLLVGLLSIMPRAWSGIRDYRLTTNNHGLTENCYYCTIAALANTDVDTVIGHTEVMQQDTAQSEEIAALFSAAGCSVAYQDFTSEAAAGNFVRNVPHGYSLAFGYTRGNGTAHMVVVMRWSSAPYGVRFIDYQMSPPGIYDSLAHEGSIIKYTIFYQP